MKTVRTLIGIPLVLPMLCFAIPYATYNTTGFAHSFDGVGRDWKGNIYIGNGNGNTDPTGNAAVFKFNFSTNALEKVFDCRATSQAAGNWLTGDEPGKIHSSIKQGSDGKLYFSTHSAIEYAGDATEYLQQFRGGHFYRYDPETRAGEDLSDPNTVPHQGILEVAQSLQKNYLFGIGYPFASIYRLNLATGQHDSVTYAPSGGGNISRKIFEDNFGHIYIPWFPNYLMEYDPVRDSLVKLSVNLGYSYISAVVKSMTGDSIYLIAIPDGNIENTQASIIRFIVSQKKIENLGRVDPANLTTSGQTSLHLRWDLNKLYFAKGNYLFSLNVITGARQTEATNLPDQTWYYGSDGVDKNGDLWFSQAFTTTVLRVSLNIPCPVCTTKFQRFMPVEIQKEKINATRPNLLELSISPNPVTGNAVIIAEVGAQPGPVRLTMHDLSGRLVQSWIWRDGHYRRPVLLH
jgi:hypothetical protein